METSVISLSANVRFWKAQNETRTKSAKCLREKERIVSPWLGTSDICLALNTFANYDDLWKE